MENIMENVQPEYVGVNHRKLLDCAEGTVERLYEGFFNHFSPTEKDISSLLERDMEEKVAERVRQTYNGNWIYNNSDAPNYIKRGVVYHVMMADIEAERANWAGVAKHKLMQVSYIEILSLDTIMRLGILACFLPANLFCLGIDVATRTANYLRGADDRVDDNI